MIPLFLAEDEVNTSLIILSEYLYGAELLVTEVSYW